MNTPAPHPANAARDYGPPSEAEQNAMRHARNMRALDRMIEIGMSMLEALGCDAREGASGFPVQRNGSAHPAPADPAQHHGEMALAFHRASRAVRLAIAMQNRLIEEAASPPVSAPLSCPPAPVGAAPPSSAGPASAAAAGAGERRARAADPDQAAVERLQQAAAEQRYDRESFGHLLGQPVEAVIEQICRDLGLPPDDAPASGADPAQPPDPAYQPPVTGPPPPPTRHPRTRCEDDAGGWGHPSSPQPLPP